MCKRRVGVHIAQYTRDVHTERTIFGWFHYFHFDTVSFWYSWHLKRKKSTN